MRNCIFKSVVAMVSTMFVLSITPQDLHAQSAMFTNKMQKKLMKEQEKAYKKKLKEYKKEGWKIAGSSRTMEVALLEHYSRLAQEGNSEVVGEVEQCRSINLCKQYAISNAQNAYASLACAKVQGKAGSLLRANQDNPSEELDKFSAAYSKHISADISGAMTESYAIVKENKTSKQYKLFFILNEDKARSSRKRAMEKSLEETKLTLEEIDMITKFVEENVETE